MRGEVAHKFFFFLLYFTFTMSDFSPPLFSRSRGGGCHPLHNQTLIKNFYLIQLTTTNSPEEAVQLDKFPPHLRPFIKDIFITKYPGIVSLHSLDAGNLSLTLGYTQLRLRKGEVLPRSRRIFHVSPTDQRHLDDITDLLCKFGYIMRSPSTPNGLHLYGMSSYLVPRAKPGCLGRLIVDFSPVNQLIESPPNVIPEINHTLQFLQFYNVVS